MKNRVTNKIGFSVSLIISLFVGSGCDDGHLRGKVTSSSDGETYFAVVDNNGGKCGPILLDGKEWAYPIGEKAKINPGRHTLKCGGEVSFDVPAGVLYEFDYWGP